jgi:hypothetical protein
LQTYGRRALAAFGKARDKGNGSPISPHGRSRAARADYVAPGSQSPGAAAPLEVSFGMKAPNLPRLV